MNKTIAFIGTDQTLEMSLPEKIYDQLVMALSFKMASTRFVATERIRGMKAEAILFDEISSVPPEDENGSNPKTR